MQPPVVVSVDGKQIAASGTIVLRDGASWQIAVADLVLNMKMDDTGDGDPIVDFQDATDRSATIVFKNFKNTLGTAWSTEIGTVENRSMTISVYVQQVNRVKFIAYTVLLGEPIAK